MPLESIGQIPSFIGGYSLSMRDLGHMSTGFRVIMEGTLLHYKIYTEQVLQIHELPFLPTQLDVLKQAVIMGNNFNFISLMYFFQSCFHVNFSEPLFVWHHVLRGGAHL